MKNWTYRIAGFIIAAGLAIAIEALIIILLNSGSYRVSPRGIGWLAVPVIFGLVGARWLEKEGEAIADRAKHKVGHSAPLRFFLASSVCWALGLIAYLFVFEPFGGYWSGADWEFVWKLMFMPPTALAAFLFVFDRFSLLGNKGKNSIVPPTDPQPTTTTDLLSENLQLPATTIPRPPLDKADFERRLQNAQAKLRP